MSSQIGEIIKYTPVLARVLNVKPHCRSPTLGDKICYLAVERGKTPEPKAGQFIEVSVFGFGEAPFSVSSWDKNSLEFTIKDMGGLSHMLCCVRPGALVGLRGPFGRGFPLHAVVGKNLLMVCGGLGLAPLRPVIGQILSSRSRFGAVALLYGARAPELLLYTSEYEKWKKSGIDLHLTVDVATKGWDKNVGVVTALLENINIEGFDFAFVCGPPVMMKYAVRKVAPLLGEENVYLSLERRMKCGAGFCGHCRLGKYFVCRDGPVFSVAELRGAGEVVEEIG